MRTGQGDPSASSSLNQNDHRHSAPTRHRTDRRIGTGQGPTADPRPIQTDHRPGTQTKGTRIMGPDTGSDLVALLNANNPSTNIVERHLQKHCITNIFWSSKQARQWTYLYQVRGEEEAYHGIQGEGRIGERAVSFKPNWPDRPTRIHGPRDTRTLKTRANSIASPDQP